MGVRFQYDNKEVGDFLQHHGVLGMRWGIRRQRRLQAVGRASKSGAALSTRTRQLGNLAFRTLPPVAVVDLVKGHGLTGAARRKFQRTTAREARIKAGKGHVRDYIVHFGGTHLTDLIPVRASKADRVTTVSDDRKIVAAHGALFVAKVLLKQSAKQSGAA